MRSWDVMTAIILTSSWGAVISVKTQTIKHICKNNLPWSWPWRPLKMFPQTFWYSNGSGLYSGKVRMKF